YMSNFIKELLDPVASLSIQVNSVEGKNVCLSGNFAYGKGKPSVAEYVVAHGGIVDSNVKKTTDILLVGKNECQAYSNGTYGTKVKKAMEYNEKGCNIAIIKETDFLFE
ncbi:MAG: BRCT domain-containing protein, partial [Clostridia bacterium]|nr:BRCT domain-containing protein [Clostridia bacterium]